MDAPQSPPGWLPSALKPLAPVQSDQLCPGFQINQAIDPSKWDAPDAPGPLPSGARTEDGYADLRGLNIADVAALRDLPRCSSLKFFEMARAAGGDRLSGLTRDDAGWADGRSSAKANSLRSLNSPCLFASLQDQWSVAAGDCSLADVAVNCGTVNIHGLCATPEPSLCLTLGGFLIVAVGAKRRMNRRPDAIVA